MKILKLNCGIIFDQVSGVLKPEVPTESSRKGLINLANSFLKYNPTERLEIRDSLEHLSLSQIRLAYEEFIVR